MRKNVAPAGFACLPTPLNSKIKGEIDSSGAGHGRTVRGNLFLYMANPDDPSYIPSYKFINSIGRLYKKSRVDRSSIEAMEEPVFEKCILCTRCYCPFGIDISALITLF